MPTLNSSHEILLTGEFPSNSSTILEFNDFFLKQPSGVLGYHRLNGITLENGNKNQVQIYSNTFGSDATEFLSFPADNWGIRLQGSIGGGNEVTGNLFTDNPNTGFPADFYAGIYALDFTNSVFCENTLREASYLMYFHGMSMGTQYFSNFHTGGADGFRVEDGFIGEQGTEGGEHNGNEWHDKWLNIIPAHHAYLLPEFQAPNSRIFVHTAQSVRNTQGLGYTLFSKYHPADIEPDQMDEWFKPDLTGFPGEGGCIDHIVISTETDKAIGSGTINLMGLSQAHSWTAKRYLYAKLRQNPGLQGDHTAFGPFLTNESNTSVGQLYSVEQKIAEGLKVSANLDSQSSQIRAGEIATINQLELADSTLNSATTVTALNSALGIKNLALSDLRTLDSLYNELNVDYQANLMLKLQEALTLNNSVTTATDYEQYEKIVNDIAIRQVLFQNGELTVPQVAALGIIAAECPKYGGHGIYRARGLLRSCNEGNWNDDNAGCYPIAEPSLPQVLDNGYGERSTAKIWGDQIIVYPNPATSSFFVRLPARQSGTITITDAIGKVWKTVPFTEGEEVRFVDLPNAPTGIYLCAVTSTNGNLQIIKVILSNK